MVNLVRMQIIISVRPLTLAGANKRREPHSVGKRSGRHSQ